MPYGCERSALKTTFCKEFFVQISQFLREKVDIPKGQLSKKVQKVIFQQKNSAKRLQSGIKNYFSENEKLSYKVMEISVKGFGKRQI